MSSLVIENIPADLLEQFHLKASAKGMSVSEYGRRLIHNEVGRSPMEPTPEENAAFMELLLSEEDKVDDFPLPPRTPDRATPFSFE